MTNQFTETMLTKLREGFKGRLIFPGDDDYDSARAVFYGWVEKRPTAIARVFNSDDVGRVVNFARENDIELPCVAATRKIYFI